MFKLYKEKRKRAKMEKILLQLKKCYISFRVELIKLNILLSQTRLTIHDLEDFKSDKDNIQKMLVDFGNYLSSAERNNNLVHEENKGRVTDADICNFQSGYKCSCPKCLFKNIGIDVEIDNRGNICLTPAQMMEIINRLTDRKERDGAELIRLERLDQIKMGRDAKYDNQYNTFKLVNVAFSILYSDDEMYNETGWPKEWFDKTIQKDYKSKLSIAGALIAAEIDRFLLYSHNQ